MASPPPAANLVSVGKRPFLALPFFFLPEDTSPTEECAILVSKSFSGRELPCAALVQFICVHRLTCASCDEAQVCAAHAGPNGRHGQDVPAPDQGRRRLLGAGVKHQRLPGHTGKGRRGAGLSSNGGLSLVVSPSPRASRDIGCSGDEYCSWNVYVLLFETTQGHVLRKDKDLAGGNALSCVDL